MKDLVVRDAAEAHATIERLAKEKAVAEMRVVEAIAVGKVVRQGDIYIHRVNDDHVRGAQTEGRQLAMGQSTGSRHVAEAPAQVFEGIKAPEWCAFRIFLGPVIEAKDRFVVTHPEHAHVSLPAGVYQVTHQMDARTGKRVVD